jgi:RNA-directed DNA polymerase
MRVVAHGIADPLILNLIRMWQVAGVVESNELHGAQRVAPRGSGISPPLANIYLHCALVQ